jgi:hypothetical protein
VKQHTYYQVTLTNGAGNSYDETFGFLPGTVDLREALDATVSVLRDNEENCGEDQLDGERAGIEASNLAAIGELIDILKPSQIQLAVDSFAHILNLKVAGVEVGTLAVVPKIMLVEDKPDAIQAYPAPSSRVHPACTTVGGHPGPVSHGGNGV